VSVGRWWSSLDHSPVFHDPHPARTIAACLVLVILLVIVAAVLIALDTGVAR
jgi:hypothetical protein